MHLNLNILYKINMAELSAIENQKREGVAKRKKKNFSDSEMNVLQNLVEQNYKVLSEKVNNNTTNK